MFGTAQHTDAISTGKNQLKRGVLVAYFVNVWPVCPMFPCLGLRNILMLCEQAKTGEDGVLVEYLLSFYDEIDKHRCSQK